MRQQLASTAIAGIMAAVLVGLGEYLLHYDAQGRFSSDGYDFMQGISANRSTLGHFIAVFGATLYPVGCYHIYLMLTPANERWAFRAFLLGTFGFIVGVVWIGSLDSVSALVQLPETADIARLIELYNIRYETLLHMIRITTLVMSAIIIWLCLTGRSHYPRWMAIFNPITLIIANFILFAVAPTVGKHSMPIALNVAFFIFFVLSLFFACRVRRSELDSH